MAYDFTVTWQFSQREQLLILLRIKLLLASLQILQMMSISDNSFLMHGQVKRRINDLYPEIASLCMDKDEIKLHSMNGVPVQPAPLDSSVLLMA
jgi:hypothetical protein